MSGTRRLKFPAVVRRFACALLVGGGLLFFSLGVPPAPGQTVPPEEPAAPPDPNTPLLPTDPNAPPTIQTPTTSLIPTRPLSILDEPHSPATPTPGSSTVPNVVPADPLALPPPPAPLPADAGTTTNNTGVARRFQYSFLLSVGATFDDNVFLIGTRKQSDLYFTIQPSVSLGFGGGVAADSSANYVRFTYSPQVLLYLENSELDTVQHFISLSGAYHLGKLTLTGAQSVQILDNTDVGNPQGFGQGASATGFTPVQINQPINNAPLSSVNLDTSQRTRLNLYITNLDANYSVSDKVSYDVGLQFTEQDYQTLLSSSALSADAYFNYSLTGKTTVGIGTSVGYTFAEKPTPDQTYEQGNLRVSYAPSAKLSASGQVGLELRQSSGQDGSQLTPIFSLSASYAPFDGTSITLDGSRQVQTSAVLGGQDYTSTTISLGFNQRFFQRLFARLNLGYTHADYTSETAGVSASRSDDYVYVQPSLDFNLRDNVTVGGYYSFRHSASSGNDRTFTDDQVGLRFSVSF